MNASSKMKFIGAILIAAVTMSSCLLPSLHPIYTDNSREIDDRIIGTWVNGELSDDEKLGLVFSNGAKIENIFRSVIDDMEVSSEGDTSINLNVDEMINDNGNNNFNELYHILNGENSIWSFERAGKLTFESYLTESTDVTITMSLGAASMAPEGFKLVDKDDLPFYILTHRELEDQDTITTRLLTNMTKIGGETYLDFYPYKINKGTFGGNFIKAHSFAKMSVDEGQLSLHMFDGDSIQDLVKNRKIRLRHEKLGDDGEIVLTASTAELRSFIEKYGDDPELFEEVGMFTKL